MPNMRHLAVTCAFAAIVLGLLASPAASRLLSGVSFFLSTDSVYFRPRVSTQTELAASAAITMKAASSIESWNVTYQALPLVGQVDTFPASRIMIKTAITGGFVPADRPQPVAKGGVIQLPGREVGTITLQLNLSGRELSDEYSGILVSPEGSPPIKVRLFTKPLINEPPPRPTPASPLEINPTMVEIDLGAGESKETELFISNNQNDEITVRPRVVNLAIDDRGEFLPEGPTDSQYSAAGWLAIDPPQLKILSWSTGQIKLRMTAPGSFAGSAHAAVLVEQISPNAKSIKEARPASKIMITRPDAATARRSRLDLFEQDAKGNFNARLLNTGNAYLTVKDASVAVMQGPTTVARFPLSPAKALVLPGGIRDFTAAWSGLKLLPPGSYKLEASIRFAQGAPATATMALEIPEPEKTPTSKTKAEKP